MMSIVCFKQARAMPNNSSSTTPLTSLPAAWQRQWLLSLPPHLRLQLRQCCRQLREVVDETCGISLRLQRGSNAAAALQLCVAQLTSLDASAVSSWEGLASVVFPGPCQLVPGCLRRLCVHVDQTSLLYFFAAAAPQLAALELRSDEAAVQVSKSECKELLEELQGPSAALASTVTHLELDQACHQALGSGDQSLARAVGSLTALRSLRLREPPQPRQRELCASTVRLDARTWAAAVQPLSQLTRLEMSAVTLYDDDEDDDDDDDGDIEHRYAAAQQRRQERQMEQQLAATASLRQLVELCVLGIDMSRDYVWSLSWVGACTQLTRVHITCSAGELDADVLAQLPALQELTLASFHDEVLTSSQLAPLAGCSRLTSLATFGLIVEAPAGGQAPLPAALRSLRRLRCGLHCQAPLATFAPHLTELGDLSSHIDCLELEEELLAEPPAGQEALAGLEGLQVLQADISSLIAHSSRSSSFGALAALRELHIEMLGMMDGSHLADGDAGLACPSGSTLTRLVLSLPSEFCHSLDITYSAAEDVLLWRRLTGLRELTLRGTRLLGGFLVYNHLLVELKQRLTALRCIALEDCQDLELAHLAQLVAAAAAPCVVVRHCARISAADCARLTAEAGGVVAVEFGGWG